MRTVLITAVLLLTAAPARAVDVYLSLSAHGQRTDLAVSGFVPKAQTMEEINLCRKMEDVLRADLLFSRYFNLVEGGPLFTGKDEELAQWENLGANVLVGGSVSSNPAAETCSVTGRLFDTTAKQVVWEKTYTGKRRDFRRLMHEMNDDIIERFTGERGIAHTRIAFVNNSTRCKELYLVDYDGQNVRHLTLDNSINLLPKWSPVGDEIIYTTYLHGNPDLYAYSMTGGYRRPVSRLQGLNTAGSYSPDGNKIALTLSKGSQPNLYLILRSGEVLRRLTSGRFIDTSPSFAPNGREIVFISDRPGYPQPYIMNLDGGNLRRLTTGGFCDSPAWSPRGDKIVFSMREGRDNFDLYLYDLASDRITRLTQDGRNNENPSWSPDGRFIVYASSLAGRSDLYVIAVDGSGKRKLLDISGSSYTPSWSP